MFQAHPVAVGVVRVPRLAPRRRLLRPATHSVALVADLRAELVLENDLSRLVALVREHAVLVGDRGDITAYVLPRRLPLLRLARDDAARKIVGVLRDTLARVEAALQIPVFEKLESTLPTATYLSQGPDGNPRGKIERRNRQRAHPVQKRPATGRSREQV